MTSEEVFAYVKPSAALGLVAGAVFPAIGGIVRKGLRRGKSGVQKMAANAPEKPNPWVLRDPGEAPRQAVEGLAPKGYARISGKAYALDPQEVQLMAGGSAVSKQARDAVARAPQTFRQINRDFTSRLGQFHDEASRGEAMWRMGMKRSAVEPVMKLGNETDTLLKSKQGLWDRAVSDMESLVDDLSIKGRRSAAANKVRKLLVDLGPTRKELDALIKAGARGLPKDSNTRAFMAIDNAKKRIDAVLEGFEGQKVIGQTDDIAMAELKDIRARIQKHLERRDLFGGAADLQKEVNGAYTKFLELERAAKGTAGLTYVKRVYDFGRKEYGVDPGKVQNFIDQLGLEKGVVGAEHMANHMKGRIELMRKLAPTIEGGEAALNKMIRLADDLSANMELANNLNLLNRVMGRLKTPGGLAGAGELQLGGGLYMVGHILGGYVYGLAGATLGTATIPKNMMYMRGVMERLSSRAPGVATATGAKQAMRSTASSKVRRALGLSYASRVGIAAELTNQDNTRTRKSFYEPKDKQKAMRRIRGELDALSDPAVLQERLSTTLGEVAKEIPELGLGMQMTATRAIQYLQAKMPKGPANLVEVMQGKEPKYSRHDVSQFFRALRAVEDPTSVLDRVKTGGVRSVDLEALQVVYPELYAKWKQLMLVYSREASKIPYWVQLEMEKFLGMPVTAASNPQSMMMLQQSFVLEQAARGQPKGWDHSKQSAGTLEDQAERMGTQPQKIEGKSD